MSTVSMMKSSYLNDLHAFASVARHQSFRKAALERNVSAAALSQSLKNLEDRLGVRLLNRTSPSVSATAAGHQLLTRLSPALQEIDEGVDHASGLRIIPTELVRLSATRAAAQIVLAPRLASFSQAHPHILLEIVTENNCSVEMLSSGVDAGIQLGDNVPSGTTAIALPPPPRMVVVGSPDYLQQSGHPDTPRDLVQHACIGRRFPSGVVHAWEFARDEDTTAIQVKGPLLLDDDALMVSAALGGAGLAYVHRSIAAPFIQHGELIEVLDDWHHDTEHFHLYHLAQQAISPALQLFIDFIRQQSKM